MRPSSLCKIQEIQKRQRSLKEHDKDKGKISVLLGNRSWEMPGVVLRRMKKMIEENAVPDAFGFDELTVKSYNIVFVS